jgi:hypothetical protein
VAVDPAEDARSLTCDLALDPGVERPGFVVGPDGQPVVGCRALNLYPGTMSGHTVELTSGEFTAIALDPKQPRPLFFRHETKRLAAVVMARGDESRPLTVRLQPAGTVTGRLLDEDGQPRPGLRIYVNFAPFRLGPGYQFPLLDTSLGDDGRFRIDGLIPGVTYNLGAIMGQLTFLGDFAIDVKVGPGETRDLGDVKVKTPR